MPSEYSERFTVVHFLSQNDLRQAVTSWKYVNFLQTVYKHFKTIKYINGMQHARAQKRIT